MKRASPAAPLMAAAEGAVDAYTHITGGEWKPGAGPITVSRQTMEAEIAAFGWGDAGGVERPHRSTRRWPGEWAGRLRSSSPSRC